MSATAYSVRRHTYLDSVFLMRVAKALEAKPGVERAAAIMATPANKELLREAGFSGPEVDAAAPDDLVVGVAAGSGELAAAAMSGLDAALAGDIATPAGGAVSWEDALSRLPDANLAVISVPDEYAAAEIEHGIEAGLHVFCFSSGVALADEVRLKQLAASREVLLMGPDCGTSIIAGKGMGFANAIRRGPVGLVGGSGTGLQAVSTLIHQAGSGVSHAIGAGSRDASDEVGGMTLFAGLQALLEDDGTRVEVVVSKEPGPAVLARLQDFAARSGKPVVTCLLGGSGSGSARTFEEAASAALRALGISNGSNGLAEPPSTRVTGSAIGLFAGGSILLEARGVLERAGIARDRYQLTDMGSEELTRGRPHPMIDSRLRVERIARAGDDTSVGALLLDVVLGRGAAVDPAGDLAPSIIEARSRARRAGRDLLVVASVTGTDQDPQNRSAQVATLQAAGAVVLPTSARAAAFVAEALR